jgi:hypothetical protein
MDAWQRAATMQWQDTKLHACTRTVTRPVGLLQWQDTKLHDSMRTVALVGLLHGRIPNCMHARRSLL